jgi:hypothetical protein
LEEVGHDVRAETARADGFGRYQPNQNNAEGDYDDRRGYRDNELAGGLTVEPAEVTVAS